MPKSILNSEGWQEKVDNCQSSNYFSGLIADIHVDM